MPKTDLNHYTITDPEGKVYDVDDLGVFCKKHDLWSGNMRKVADGKVKTCKGWNCQYVDKASGNPNKGIESTKDLYFNLIGAMDLNMYYEDFELEDLKNRDLMEFYNEVVEDFDDERSSYIYHDQGLENLVIDEDENGDCKLNINKAKSDLKDNEVRIIFYYYYDYTDYAPCYMQLQGDKEINITINPEVICEGFECVESINLADGFNEESEDDELYFELESADPDNEEAATPKIAICTNKGMVGSFVIAHEDNPAERFIEIINSI